MQLQANKVAAPRISAHMETHRAEPTCRGNRGAAGGKPRRELHAGGSRLPAMYILPTKIQWGFIDSVHDVAGIRRNLI
jgi:hypothetical protein